MGGCVKRLWLKVIHGANGTLLGTQIINHINSGEPVTKATGIQWISQFVVGSLLPSAFQLLSDALGKKAGNAGK